MRFPFVKIIAWVTLTAFLYTGVLYQPLQAAVQDFREQRAGTAVADESADMIIPAKFGRITGGRMSDTSRLVIYIQDLHCNPTVQRNIYGILNVLGQRYPVTKLFVEGAPAGHLQGSVFSRISDADVRTRTADALLSKGLLSGDEYYAFKERKNNLYGLEDWQLYQDNLVRIKGLLEEKEAHARICSVIESAIRARAEQNLSRRLRAVCHALYRGGDLPARYRRLEQIGRKVGEPLSEYPALDAQCRLQSLNRRVSYRRIPGELRACMAELKSRLSYADYHEIAEKLNEKNQLEDLYLLLAHTVPEAIPDISRRYPNLSLFLTTVALSQRINPAYLLSEERHFERRILQRCAATRLDREMIFLLEMSQYLRDYAALSIMPDDYERFAAGREQFIVLLQKHLGTDIPEVRECLLLAAHPGLDAFYKNNTLRTARFVDAVAGGSISLKNSLPRQGGTIPVGARLDSFKEIYVVVAGGFHTAVADALEKKSFSTLIITPAAGETMKTGLYERVLTQRIAPSDILMSGLPAPRGNIADVFKAMPLDQQQEYLQVRFLAALQVVSSRGQYRAVIDDYRSAAAELGLDVIESSAGKLVSLILGDRRYVFRLTAHGLRGIQVFVAREGRWITAEDTAGSRVPPLENYSAAAAFAVLTPVSLATIFSFYPALAPFSDNSLALNVLAAVISAAASMPLFIQCNRRFYEFVRWSRRQRAMEKIDDGLVLATATAATDAGRLPLSQKLQSILAEQLRNKLIDAVVVKRYASQPVRLVRSKARRNAPRQLTLVIGERFEDDFSENQRLRMLNHVLWHARLSDSRIAMSLRAVPLIGGMAEEVLVSLRQHNSFISGAVVPADDVEDDDTPGPGPATDRNGLAQPSRATLKDVLKAVIRRTLSSFKATVYQPSVALWEDAEIEQWKNLTAIPGSILVREKEEGQTHMYRRDRSVKSDHHIVIMDDIGTWADPNTYQDMGLKLATSPRMMAGIPTIGLRLSETNGAVKTIFKTPYVFAHYFVPFFKQFSSFLTAIGILFSRHRTEAISTFQVGEYMQTTYIRWMMSRLRSSATIQSTERVTVDPKLTLRGFVLQRLRWWSGLLDVMSTLITRRRPKYDVESNDLSRWNNWRKTHTYFSDPATGQGWLEDPAIPEWLKTYESLIDPEKIAYLEGGSSTILDIINEGQVTAQDTFIGGKAAGVVVMAVVPDGVMIVTPIGEKIKLRMPARLSKGTKFNTAMQLWEGRLGLMLDGKLYTGENIRHFPTGRAAEAKPWTPYPEAARKADELAEKILERETSAAVTAYHKLAGEGQSDPDARADIELPGDVGQVIAPRRFASFLSKVTHGKMDFVLYMRMRYFFGKVFRGQYIYATLYGEYDRDKTVRLVNEVVAHGNETGAADEYRDKYEAYRKLYGQLLAAAGDLPALNRLLGIDATSDGERALRVIGLMSETGNAMAVGDPVAGSMFTGDRHSFTLGDAVKPFGWYGRKERAVYRRCTDLFSDYAQDTTWLWGSDTAMKNGGARMQSYVMDVLPDQVQQRLGAALSREVLTLIDNARHDGYLIDRILFTVDHAGKPAMTVVSPSARRPLDNERGNIDVEKVGAVPEKRSEYERRIRDLLSLAGGPLRGSVAFCVLTPEEYESLKTGEIDDSGARQMIVKGVPGVADDASRQRLTSDIRSAIEEGMFVDRVDPAVAYIHEKIRQEKMQPGHAFPDFKDWAIARSSLEPTVVQIRKLYDTLSRQWIGELNEKRKASGEKKLFSRHALKTGQVRFGGSDYRLILELFGKPGQTVDLFDTTRWYSLFGNSFDSPFLGKIIFPFKRPFIAPRPMVNGLLLRQRAAEGEQSSCLGPSVLPAESVGLVEDFQSGVDMEAQPLAPVPPACGAIKEGAFEKARRAKMPPIWEALQLQAYEGIERSRLDMETNKHDADILERLGIRKLATNIMGLSAVSIMGERSRNALGMLESRYGSGSWQDPRNHVPGLYFKGNFLAYREGLKYYRGIPNFKLAVRLLRAYAGDVDDRMPVNPRLAAAIALNYSDVEIQQQAAELARNRVAADIAGLGSILSPAQQRELQPVLENYPANVRKRIVAYLKSVGAFNAPETGPLIVLLSNPVMMDNPAATGVLFTEGQRQEVALGGMVPAAESLIAHYGRHGTLMSGSAIRKMLGLSKRIHVLADMRREKYEHRGFRTVLVTGFGWASIALMANTAYLMIKDLISFQDIESFSFVALSVLSAGIFFVMMVIVVSGEITPLTSLGAYSLARGFDSLLFVLTRLWRRMGLRWERFLVSITPFLSRDEKKTMQSLFNRRNSIGDMPLPDDAPATGMRREDLPLDQDDQPLVKGRAVIRNKKIVFKFNDASPGIFQSDYGRLHEELDRILHGVQHLHLISDAMILDKDIVVLNAGAFRFTFGLPGPPELIIPAQLLMEQDAAKYAQNVVLIPFMLGTEMMMSYVPARGEEALLLKRTSYMVDCFLSMNKEEQQLLLLALKRLEPAALIGREERQPLYALFSALKDDPGVTRRNSVRRRRLVAQTVLQLREVPATRDRMNDAAKKIRGKVDSKPGLVRKASWLVKTGFIRRAMARILLLVVAIYFTITSFGAGTATLIAADFFSAHVTPITEQIPPGVPQPSADLAPLVNGAEVDDAQKFSLSSYLKSTWDAAAAFTAKVADTIQRSATSANTTEAPTATATPAPTAPESTPVPVLVNNYMQDRDALAAGIVPAQWTVPREWGINDRGVGIYSDKKNALAVKGVGTARSSAIAVDPAQTYQFEGMVDVISNTFGNTLTIMIEEGNIVDGEFRVLTRIRSVEVGADDCVYFSKWYKPLSDNVTAVRISIEGAEGLSALIDGLNVHKKVKLDRPVALIRFDDGYKSQLKAAQILNSKGGKGTFNIISSYPGYDDFIPWAGFPSLLEAGNQVGSHSRTHAENMEQLPTDSLVSELQGAYEDFKAHGIDATTLAIPYSQQGPRVARYAMRNYASMQVISGTPDNKYAMVQAFAADVSYKEVIEQIDAALAGGFPISLCYHRFVESPDEVQYETQVTYDDFARTIDYLNSKGVALITVDEMVKSMSSGNLLPNGGFEEVVATGSSQPGAVDTAVPQAPSLVTDGAAASIAVSDAGYVLPADLLTNTKKYPQDKEVKVYKLHTRLIKTPVSYLPARYGMSQTIRFSADERGRLNMKKLAGKPYYIIDEQGTICWQGALGETFKTDPVTNERIYDVHAGLTKGGNYYVVLAMDDTFYLSRRFAVTDDPFSSDASVILQSLANRRSSNFPELSRTATFTGDTFSPGLKMKMPDSNLDEANVWFFTLLQANYVNKALPAAKYLPGSAADNQKLVDQALFEFDWLYAMQAHDGEMMGSVAQIEGSAGLYSEDTLLKDTGRRYVYGGGKKNFSTVTTSAHSAAMGQYVQLLSGMNDPTRLQNALEAQLQGYAFVQNYYKTHDKPAVWVPEKSGVSGKGLIRGGYIEDFRDLDERVLSSIMILKSFQTDPRAFEAACAKYNLTIDIAQVQQFVKDNYRQLLVSDYQTPETSNYDMMVARELAFSDDAFIERFGLEELHDRALLDIIAYGDRLVAVSEANSSGIAATDDRRRMWGSNMHVATNAENLLWAHKAHKEIYGYYSGKYVAAALRNWNYLVQGTGQDGMGYVSGLGIDGGPKNLHDTLTNHYNQGMADGLMVGGPTVYNAQGAPEGVARWSDDNLSYRDEVSIESQTPLVNLAKSLMDSLKQFIGQFDAGASRVPGPQGASAPTLETQTPVNAPLKESRNSVYGLDPVKQGIIKNAARHSLMFIPLLPLTMSPAKRKKNRRGNRGGRSDGRTLMLRGIGQLRSVPLIGPAVLLWLNKRSFARRWTRLMMQRTEQRLRADTGRNVDSVTDPQTELYPGSEMVQEGRRALKGPLSMVLRMVSSVLRAAPPARPTADPRIKGKVILRSVAESAPEIEHRFAGYAAAGMKPILIQSGPVGTVRGNSFPLPPLSIPVDGVMVVADTAVTIETGAGGNEWYRFSVSAAADPVRQPTDAARSLLNNREYLNRRLLERAPLAVLREMLQGTMDPSLATVARTLGLPPIDSGADAVIEMGAAGAAHPSAAADLFTYDPDLNDALYIGQPALSAADRTPAVMFADMLDTADAPDTALAVPDGVPGIAAVSHDHDDYLAEIAVLATAKKIRASARGRSVTGNGRPAIGGIGVVADIAGKTLPVLDRIAAVSEGRVSYIEVGLEHPSAGGRVLAHEGIIPVDVIDWVAEAGFSHARRIRNLVSPLEQAAECYRLNGNKKTVVAALARAGEKDETAAYAAAMRIDQGFAGYIRYVANKQLSRRREALHSSGMAMVCAVPAFGADMSADRIARVAALWLEKADGIRLDMRRVSEPVAREAAALIERRLEAASSDGVVILSGNGALKDLERARIVVVGGVLSADAVNEDTVCAALRNGSCLELTVTAERIDAVEPAVRLAARHAGSITIRPVESGDTEALRFDHAASGAFFFDRLLDICSNAVPLMQNSSSPEAWAQQGEQRGAAAADFLLDRMRKDKNGVIESWLNEEAEIIVRIEGKSSRIAGPWLRVLMNLRQRLDENSNAAIVFQDRELTYLELVKVLTYERAVVDGTVPEVAGSIRDMVATAAKNKVSDGALAAGVASFIDGFWMRVATTRGLKNMILKDGFLAAVRSIQEAA